ncbi:YihY/virulence factor BrkB family protein [Methylocystis sp. JR02]|uniref:YihY/virulence factor BrkB family protein n=1 Tax=Methylocystis sp. JR02 TaxID=3046284 RepID=UPI0024B880E0|nr:YihY/virulence factor BrkB family protein [Methylocystis sp. JR02]MDJ0447184.1 YihY/virulence factor BrkB family protein [Methylocystis sp. JR02]
MAGKEALSADPAAIERGRAATTPSEIPARGWKDVLARVYDDINQHRILAIAAGVTFYALLAIFPAIAAFVAIYGLVADPSTISGHLQALSGFLPAEGLSIIGDQIQRIAAQGATKLGFASIIGLLFSLWSANAGMKAIFDALNVVYQEEEKRGFLKLNAISLGFTLAGMALLALSLGAMVILPRALEAVGMPAQIGTWASALRWPILLLVIAIATSVVYRYGPSRDRAQWRWVSWGAAFAAIFWLIASLLFSWYAANLGKFNETYGSLGAAIGFMLWLWVSAIVLLVGAELDAEMEHQTAKDTTTGAPQPLGERGAVMADTIGQPKS